MIIRRDRLAMALLLPGSGRRHRLRMAMNRPAQVTGHQIDRHGRQHQNHEKPNAPIPMGMLPIWPRAMMTVFAMRLFAPILTMFSIIHIFIGFANRLRAPATMRLKYRIVAFAGDEKVFAVLFIYGNRHF